LEDKSDAAVTTSELLAISKRQSCAKKLVT